MLKYYFDVDDGDQKSHDQEGTRLADRQAARIQALSLLPEIARDIYPSSDRRVLSCRVRDENGNGIFIATLSLVGEWLE